MVFLSTRVKLLIIAVVVAGSFFSFGLYFIRIQEDNLRYCRETQEKIDVIAKDPNTQVSSKDQQINKIIGDAVNELRKRQFRCPDAFLVTPYNQTARTENPP